jgi:integrase
MRRTATGRPPDDSYRHLLAGLDRRHERSIQHRFGCGWTRERDQAIVALIAHCGLLPREALGLDLPDLELEGRHPVVHVRVPLPEEPRRSLRAWLAIRGENPPAAVFITRDFERVSASEFAASMANLPREEVSA